MKARGGCKEMEHKSGNVQRHMAATKNIVAMAAIGLPDDKMEFLLTVLKGDHKDWPKIKKAIIVEYRTNPASSKEASLNQMQHFAME